MKIFVYGTLKRGFGNNPVLGDATFLCEDVTQYPYVMLDAGFPVLLSARAKDFRYLVTGEVFEIPDDAHGASILRGLDRLEGEGRMYHRRVTITQGGHIVSIYIGDEDSWAGHSRDISKSRRVKVDTDAGTVSYVTEQ